MGSETFDPRILCEDLLIRIKEEFLSEALRIVEAEIKSGNIKLNGHLITSAEQDRENEEQLFIARNLAKEQPRIREKYLSLLDSAGGEKDPRKIEQVDKLRRFLLSVDAISLLMAYIAELEAWISEIPKNKQSNIPEILESTINGIQLREDIIDTVTKKSSFVENNVISKEESYTIKRLLSNKSPDSSKNE